MSGGCSLEAEITIAEHRSNGQLERRMLQTVIGIVAVVPLLAGGAGALLGLDILHIADAPVSAESHFRYLSGLLFAIGLSYWSCLPGIERHWDRIRLLTAIVFIGGLARGYGLLHDGVPSAIGVAALIIELGIAPTVLLWHRRITSLSQRTFPHGLQNITPPKL